MVSGDMDDAIEIHASCQTRWASGSEPNYIGICFCVDASIEVRSNF